MQRKVSGAWRILRKRGLGGVVQRILWYANRWWTSDHEWLGRIVELTGNQAVIDGVRFDLSNPVIGTPQKASFLLRNYEYGERLALQLIPLHIGLPLIELGGSIGVVACISSQHFGNLERHVVVEANPALIPVLTANRDLNGCHFQIMHAALAYGAADVTFHVHSKFVKSSLHQVDETAQAVCVSGVTLRQILDQNGWSSPVVLLCDIEGAETGLFEHEADLLRKQVKYLSIEFHPAFSGKERVENIIKQLGDWGFRLQFQHQDNYLFCNESMSTTP